MIDPLDVGLVNCFACGADLLGERTARRVETARYVNAPGLYPPACDLPACRRNWAFRPMCPHPCVDVPLWQPVAPDLGPRDGRPPPRSVWQTDTDPGFDNAVRALEEDR